MEARKSAGRFGARRSWSFRFSNILRSIKVRAHALLTIICEVGSRLPIKRLEPRRAPLLVRLSRTTFLNRSSNKRTGNDRADDDARIISAGCIIIPRRRRPPAPATVAATIAAAAVNLHHVCRLGYAGLRQRSRARRCNGQRWNDQTRAKHRREESSDQSHGVPLCVRDIGGTPRIHGTRTGDGCSSNSETH